MGRQSLSLEDARVDARRYQEVYRSYDGRVPALCPDGRVRMVEYGAPDSYFSAPARARLDGRSWARGFLTAETVAGWETATADDPAVWKFVPYNC